VLIYIFCLIKQEEVMPTYEEIKKDVNSWLDTLSADQYKDVTSKAKAIAQVELNYPDAKAGEILAKFPGDQSNNEDYNFVKSIYVYLNEIRK
jgi:hypothetical protein